MIEKFDDYNVSETGNWNVANSYAETKIMKPLYLADEYETTAYFGTSSLMEEMQTQGMNKDVLRVSAFKRLVKILIQLIDNTSFAIKKPGDKVTLLGYKEDLKKIEKLIPIISTYKTNFITKSKEMNLDKKTFDYFLDKVSQIKADINLPLNNSHLIFTNKEEYDPQKAKQRIMEDAGLHG